MLSRVDRTAASERRVDPGLGEDPIALLYYDRSGHFAAQFMKRDRSADRPTAEAPEVAGTGTRPLNNSRAQSGYDAYFGTYTVDDRLGIVTQRLVGALAPENVGQVVTRAITVAGDELTISLETAAAGGEPITKTLAWRRTA